MPQAPNIQNNLQYVTDGLEIVSNSDAIHTRDDRGNLTLTSGSATNQAVIIENNYDSFTNRSFVNASKTAFNYFKFPPTRFYPSASIPDFSGLLDPADDVIDQTLTARYTLPYLGDPGDFGSENKQINTRYSSTWYNGNGTNNSGFRRIPFVGPNQAEEGAYVMDPSIIKLLRDNNKTLEFSFFMQFPNDGQPIFLRFNRGGGENAYRAFQDGSGAYKISSNIFLLNTYPLSANPQQWPWIRWKYRINTADNAFIGPEQGTARYDKFTIDAMSNNIDSNGNITNSGAWISRGGSWWNIAPIDLPDFNAPGAETPSSFYGMRDISCSTDLLAISFPNGPTGQYTVEETLYDNPTLP